MNFLSLASYRLLTLLGDANKKKQNFKVHVIIWSVILALSTPKWNARYKPCSKSQDFDMTSKTQGQRCPFYVNYTSTVYFVL